VIVLGLYFVRIQVLKEKLNPEILCTMKTKTTTLITIMFFALSFSIAAERPVYTLKVPLFDEKHMEISIIVEQTLKDIDLDLSAIFSDIWQSEPEIANPGFDIRNIVYEEPETDDLEIDTRAVFQEILNENLNH